MFKLLSFTIIGGFAALMTTSSCNKTSDNPVGAYTCSCYFVDSVNIDTTKVTFDRMTLNAAKTQCANKQGNYMMTVTAGQTVTCSLNH